MSEFILEIIKTYKDYAFVFVFVIAFVESMVLVGIFLPGWLLLIGIGGLIGADLLDFYPIVISSYFGAVIGEYVSFYLGFHYHDKILSYSIFKKRQNLINHSHLFFKKHGAAGVFIGRFFGPTRALVPFLAGLSEMPQKTFFWINCLSGLLWAPLYLIPGILVGSAFAIEQDERNLLLLMMFLVIFSGGLAIKYIQEYFYLERNKKTTLLLFKATLSFVSSIIVMLLFIKSPQWDVFKQILLLVYSKV